MTYIPSFILISSDVTEMSGDKHTHSYTFKLVVVVVPSDPKDAGSNPETISMVPSTQ